MNRTARCLFVGLSLCAATLANAQVPASSTSGLTATPKDVATADALLAALYDANSVMVDQKRDSARFRSLFLPEARLIPTVHLANNQARAVTETVDAYITSAMRGQPRGGFSEREIARTSETFGSIMQVFSTYETHRSSADQNPARGINSIQLFNDGTRWWVVTVLWDNERSGQAIPSIYLKTGAKSP